MIHTNLKSETLGVLRNCDLMGGVYTETMTGVTTHFVRCIPYVEGRGTASWRDMPKEEKTKCIQRCLKDLKANGMDSGCILSNNDAFGGDYLRVERGSNAWHLICQMKS